MMENYNYDGMYNISNDGVLLGINKIANIPEDVDGLGKGWLDTLGEMEVINIPATCRIIQPPITCPYNCNVKTRQFNIDENNQDYASVNGSIYTSDKKTFLLYPTGKDETTFRIPDSVEVIADKAMLNAKFKNLHVGSNIKKIKKGAFLMCKNLSRIYISSPDTEFDEDFFPRGDCFCDSWCGFVGGKKGGALEKSCIANEVDFVAIEESEVEKFFSATNEELWEKIKEQLDLEGDITIEAPEDGLRLKIKAACLEISVLDNFDSAEINEDSLCKKISIARRDRIKTIIIGDGIKSLNKYAFSSFGRIQDFYIGADVEYISPLCFSNDCGNSLVSSIEVDSENKNFKSINSVIYSHNLKELILYPSGKNDRFFEIPSFVGIIKSLSFAGAYDLESIKINANVQKVEDDAFSLCGIKKIYFDENINDFGKYLFFQAGGCDDPRVYPYNCRFKCAGKIGSPIENYCAENGLEFEAVEDAYQF